MALDEQGPQGAIRVQAGLVAAAMLASLACRSGDSGNRPGAATKSEAGAASAGGVEGARGGGPSSSGARAPGGGGPSSSGAGAGSSSGSASTSGAPSSSATSTSDAALAPRMLYGVTVDAIDALGEITAALSALPRRATVRVVFDEGQAPSYYAQAVPAIHAVANVMGELLDSQYMKNATVADYTARTSAYLAAFPKTVDIWEIGNEINGNWLGAAADVSAKMVGAYDLVKAAGGRTALTLYGCSDSGNAFDMIVWVNANVPARVRAGLDYVLVSYYEGDCGSPRASWPAAFDQLRQLFPTAGLGFGEVGAVDSSGTPIADPTIAGAYLKKYYGMKVTTPGYVGGYFWWYFAEQMVPKSRPLFPILSAAIGAMP